MYLSMYTRIRAQKKVINTCCHLMEWMTSQYIMDLCYITYICGISLLLHDIVSGLLYVCDWMHFVSLSFFCSTSLDGHPFEKFHTLLPPIMLTCQEFRRKHTLPKSVPHWNVVTNNDLNVFANNPWISHSIGS